jgi:hypothetical protein
LPNASETYLKDPENDGLVESSDDEDAQKDDPMDDTEEEEEEAGGGSSDSSDSDSDDDDVQTKIEKAQVGIAAFHKWLHTRAPADDVLICIYSWSCTSANRSIHGFALPSTRVRTHDGFHWANRCTSLPKTSIHVVALPQIDAHHCQILHTTLMMIRLVFVRLHTGQEEEAGVGGRQDYEGP